MGCSQEKYPLNAFFQIIQKYKIQHTPLEFSLFCCWQSSNPMWISSSLLLKCQFANKAPKQNSTRIQGYLLYLLYMANQHQRLVHGWMGWQIRYICFLLCLAPNHTFDSMTQTTSCHLPCTQLGGKITKPRGLLGFSTNAMWLPFCDKKDVVFFRNKQDIIKCIQMWVYWILYMYVYIYIYIYLCIYNYTFLVLPGSMFPCYLHGTFLKVPVKISCNHASYHPLLMQVFDPSKSGITGILL